jgi:hypothetical protein
MSSACVPVNSVLTNALWGNASNSNKT